MTSYIVKSEHLKVSRDTLHNVTVIAYGALVMAIHRTNRSCLDMWPWNLPMCAISPFAGQNEPAFARYTFQVPVLEPTTPVVTVAPTHSSTVACSISPPAGTVLNAFDITCKASPFCSTGCSYCFKTDTGQNVSLRGIEYLSVGCNE